MQATAANRQFVAIPAGVTERMKVAKLSACARDLYFHLCENQNFKTHDSRTYQRTDEDLSEKLKRKEDTIRHARMELVRHGFIEQAWHKTNKRRVVGTRVFYIKFDFAPPRRAKAKKVVDEQTRFRDKPSQKSGGPPTTFPDHEKPPNPRPERVSSESTLPALDTLTESIDKGPPPLAPPSYAKIFSLWNSKRGEEEEEEIFFPDLKKALAGIQSRHGLDEEESSEVFCKAIGSTLTPEIGRPIYYSETLDGKRAIRDALKTASPSLTTAFKPEPPKTMEKVKDDDSLFDSNVSRPARFGPAGWVEDRMEHARVARDALVRAGLAIHYTDVELIEMRASLEARAAGIAKGERHKSIQLDGPGPQSGFGQGVREIIGRLKHAQRNRPPSEPARGDDARFDRRPRLPSGVSA